ncbi:hypothetical protein BH10ACI3_BH10ACI3_22450 [soil metagenome]
MTHFADFADKEVLTQSRKDAKAAKVRKDEGLRGRISNIVLPQMTQMKRIRADQHGIIFVFWHYLFYLPDPLHLRHLRLIKRGMSTC